MGGGSYSEDNRVNNMTHNVDYVAYNAHNKSHEEIFTKREIDNEMNPKGVKLREARDSDEHPESLGIMIVLDETGSMYTIPEYLVKDGLPSTINNIFAHGIKHPQVMFCGVGDHKADRSPFQVGQFESSDELLDQWLTKIHLEGNGGGNGGESYHLAWYFAAFKTELDCLEKRDQKGILITIGDEPVHPTLSSHSIKKIFGDGDTKDWTAVQLLSEASKKYHVFHINVEETMNGSSPRVKSGWRELLGDSFVSVKTKDDIAETLANLVAKSCDSCGSPSVEEDDDAVKVIL